jgi:sterol desaturase/sphingolipid hydroxylase (fatty acid hydroxylase superfamily)
MPWIWTALLWSLFVLLAGLEVYYPHDARAPFRDQRWPVNLALGVLNSTLAALVPVTAIWLAVWASQHNFGLLNWAKLSDAALIAATWIAYSFATYALHRLSHTLPWLWRIHRIHHCDPHLDVSTTLRHHPLETVASTLFLGSVAAILGLSPSGIASYELIAFVIGAFSHSNISVPVAVNRALGWLIVMPAFHRMHHSVEQAETDSNFADVFAIWDRLGGTLKPTREYVQCGLHEVAAQEAGSLTRQLQMPWLKIEATRPIASSRAPIE